MLYESLICHLQMLRETYTYLSEWSGLSLVANKYQILVLNHDKNTMYNMDSQESSPSCYFGFHSNKTLGSWEAAFSGTPWPV
jgi:hypothetical protein